MKSIILEALPAAVLIGIESFLVGFGAVWLLFASIMPKPFWFWLGVASGLIAASLTIWALLRNAIRVADRENDYLRLKDEARDSGN